MKSKRAVTLFPALSTILVGPCGTALAGTEPSPWHTTSLRTDISGDALVDPPDPGCDADTVPLTGQLHVVTRLRMSDTGGLSGDVTNPGPPEDQALPVSVGLLFDPAGVLMGVNASIQRIGVGQ